VTIDRFPDRRLDMKITRTIALGLVLGIALPGAALAKGGSDDNGGSGGGGGGGNSRETRVAGSCTGGSSAKLKAKPDDGRLETEFEVDQNRTGVRWDATLKRNGKQVASARPTTRGASGSFELRRVIADGPGADRVAAKAVSPSGETCRAQATFP
jgi:hypothetical protein